MWVIYGGVDVFGTPRFYTKQGTWESLTYARVGHYPEMAAVLREVRQGKIVGALYRLPNIPEQPSNPTLNTGTEPA